MNRRVALRTLLTVAGAAAITGCQGFVPRAPLGRLGGDGKPLSLKVQEALRKHPETAHIQIEVFSSEDNVVVLKGTVGSEAEYYAAERVATGVEGVSRVDAALYVR